MIQHEPDLEELERTISSNEQLNNALYDIINSGIEAKNFLVGEVPDVIDQLLMWEVINNIMVLFTFLCGVCAVIVFIKLTIRGSYHYEYSKLNYDDENYMPTSNFKEITSVSYGIISASGSIGIIITFFNCVIPSIKNIIQIYIAPKIFLIDYVSSMVK